MKVIKIENINMKLQKLYHTNTNHYNSKIYYKDGIYTTIYKRVINLYNMFIKYEKYINYFCPGLVCLIEENGKLKGYQMKKGRRVTEVKFFKYINKNKEKLIEFMEKSGYFYCDWKSSNMILIDNKISLIDLDSFNKIQKGKHNKFYGLKIDWYITKTNEIAKLVK